MTPVHSRSLSIGPVDSSDDLLHKDILGKAYTRLAEVAQGRIKLEGVLVDCPKFQDTIDLGKRCIVKKILSRGEIPLPSDEATKKLFAEYIGNAIQAVVKKEIQERTLFWAQPIFKEVARKEIQPHLRRLIQDIEKTTSLPLEGHSLQVYSALLNYSTESVEKQHEEDLLRDWESNPMDIFERSYLPEIQFFQIEGLESVFHCDEKYLVLHFDAAWKATSFGKKLMRRREELLADCEFLHPPIFPLRCFFKIKDSSKTTISQLSQRILTLNDPRVHPRAYQPIRIT